MSANQLARWSRISAFVFAISLHTGLAHADFLINLDVSLTPMADGTTRYDYRLTNLAESDESVAALIIGVSSDAALSDITSPVGWGVLYAPGDTAIAWLSPEIDLDLAPGTSTVFSITSPLSPGAQDYLVLGAIFNAADGLIASPSVTLVPEPASLSLVALGLLVVSGGSRLIRGGCGNSTAAARNS